MPERVKDVELYEGDEPIFDAYGIEDEIQRALSRKVPLPSGGYLIIDQAEALTAIDVNTGASSARARRTWRRRSSRPTSRPSRRSPTSSASATSAASSSSTSSTWSGTRTARRCAARLEELLQKDKAKTTLNRISRARPHRDDAQAHAREPRPHCCTSPASTATAPASSSRSRRSPTRSCAQIRRERMNLPGYIDRRERAPGGRRPAEERRARRRARRPSARFHAPHRARAAQGVPPRAVRSRRASDARPWQTTTSARATEEPRGATSASRSTRSSSRSTRSSTSTSRTSRAPACSSARRRRSPIGTKVNLRFTVIMDDIETIEGVGEVVRVETIRRAWASSSRELSRLLEGPHRQAADTAASRLSRAPLEADMWARQEHAQIARPCFFFRAEHTLVCSPAVRTHRCDLAAISLGLGLAISSLVAMRQQHAASLRPTRQRGGRRAQRARARRRQGAEGAASSEARAASRSTRRRS